MLRKLEMTLSKNALDSGLLGVFCLRPGEEFNLKSHKVTVAWTTRVKTEFKHSVKGERNVTAPWTDWNQAVTVFLRIIPKGG